MFINKLQEEHFKDRHYLCLDPGCLEKKFVVFPTDIDLKIHEVRSYFFIIVIFYPSSTIL